MATKPSASLTVCLTGSESTGKTTLATALAAELDAPLVLEVARSYLSGSTGYTRDDVLAIAVEQHEREQTALAGSPPLLICDTDLLVIGIWWEVKYGDLHPWLLERLNARAPRCYLLTNPEVPWKPDPLRETGGARDALHNRFRKTLENDGFPFVEVRGNEVERLAQARDQIEAWRSLS
jgi:nicotinamide riboside kinase